MPSDQRCSSGFFADCRRRNSRLQQKRDIGGEGRAGHHVAAQFCVSRRQHPQPAQHERGGRARRQSRENPAPPSGSYKPSRLNRWESSSRAIIPVIRKPEHHEEDVDADEAARGWRPQRRGNSPPASRRWRAGHRYPADSDLDEKGGIGRSVSAKEYEICFQPLSRSSARRHFRVRKTSRAAHWASAKIRASAGPSTALESRFSGPLNRPFGGLKNHPKAPFIQ